MSATRLLGRFAAGLSAVVLVGCDHTAPFDTVRPDAGGPFGGTAPVQLTYNSGPDQMAAFANDSTLLYAWQRPGPSPTAAPDACLSFLPARGGTAAPELCPATIGSRDSVDRLEWPAPSGDSLAYLRSSRANGARVDQSVAIVLAADTADGGRRLREFPALASSGRVHLTADGLAWLAPGRLLYQGITEQSLEQCPGCPSPLKLRYPTEVAILDVATGAIAPVPGTDRPLGAAPDGATGALLYARTGSSAVYRADPSGTAQVLHDFGADQQPRDPRALPGRLVAVVGGRLRPLLDPVGDTVLQDFGGNIVVVDLATGATQRLDGGARLFRHPAVSPTGRVLVAEGWDLLITRNPGGGVDTTIIGGPNLYRFDLP